MKVDNKRSFIVFRYIIAFLLAVIVGDLLLSQLEGSIHRFFEDHIPALTAGGIILFLAMVRVNYFSYEDDYEIIQIQSKSLVFGSLGGPARQRYDFPKRIVKSVRLKRVLFQQVLVVELQTQSGEKKINKFDLSFVKKQHLNSIYESLKNIASRNNEKGEFNLSRE